MEIKSVLPFLLQEYILRSLLCLCARRQRCRNASFVIFFNYSKTKVWRQVYKLIQLHPTLNKLDASVDDDGDGNDNNNNNNSLAFG